MGSKGNVEKKPWKGVGADPTPRKEVFPTRVCCVIDSPEYDEDPQPVDDQQDEATVLYEDRYCKLTNDFLSLKTYYFPTAKTKRIPLFSIVSIRNVENREGCVVWGTVDGKTWWSHDRLRFVRCRLDLSFVIDCGELLAKGLTIRRPSLFFDALSTIRPELTKNLKEISRRRNTQSTDSYE